MRTKAAFLSPVVLICLSSCTQATDPSKFLRTASTEVQFKAEDGTKGFGDLYKGPVGTKSVVLMFHQAGSSAGEYLAIAPRVSKLGFDCLAIDQRSGGVMFGLNWSIKEHPGPQTYEGAYLDVEGALDWAKTQGYSKIIVWGSSYSASLALRLVAEHPEIRGVLSFSPGEYFDQKDVVARWAALDRIPTLMAFTEDEAGSGGQELFKKLLPSSKNVIISFPGGVHGSSTLLAHHSGTEQYWMSVEAFLVGLR